MDTNSVAPEHWMATVTKRNTTLMYFSSRYSWSNARTWYDVTRVVH